MESIPPIVHMNSMRLFICCGSNFIYCDQLFIAISNTNNTTVIVSTS